MMGEWGAGNFVVKIPVKLTNSWARLEALMRLNQIEAKKVKEVRQGESTHQKHPMVRSEPHDVMFDIVV